MEHFRSWVTTLISKRGVKIARLASSQGAWDLQDKYGKVTE